MTKLLFGFLGALSSVLLAATGCSTASPPADTDLDASTSDAGSSTSDAGLSDAGPPSDAGSLAAAIAATGSEVALGKFEVADLAGCCDPGRSCSGNNPSSPYLPVHLPRAKGQTFANANERADGTSATFRLGRTEAVVLVGTIPPRAAYFGLTPYLMNRESTTPNGPRAAVFASLSETLNHAVVRVDAAPGADVFGQRFAVIATADRGTEARLRAALITSGIADRAINTMTLDATVLRMGLEPADDEIGLFGRVALFEDPVAGSAWVANPGFQVLRVTPASSPVPAPLPPPADRPKGVAVEDPALSAALDRLEAAIRAGNASRTIRALAVTAGSADPSSCIENLRNCNGDNRDTLYPAVVPPFRLGAEESLYVFGVDHAKTAKVTYASASVYSVDHLAGLTAVTSREWGGSATAWLPGDPDATRLFAWRIARDCGTDPHCLVVPTTACPTGAPFTSLLTAAFRTYLEPDTGTGPEASTLIRERALLVQ